MIYTPQNFTENTRGTNTVTVKRVVNGIDVVYSSMGKEIIGVITNNITTATAIINHIVSTSGTYFAGETNTLGRIRKDVHYGS